MIRLIAKCHIEMKQNKEALIAAKDAEELDPKSLQTNYILFLIFTKEGNVDQGK